MSKKTTLTGELVYGIHSVIELLRAKKRKVISIYTTKPTPKAWSTIEKLLPKYPINIQYVSRETLNKIAESTDHQGILAWAQPYTFRKKFFTPEKESFLLMLDSIQDVGNLGAILRSAYCTGVQGVIVTKKKSAPLTAAAHKASAGLAEHLSIYQAASSESAIQELQKAGYSIYLTTFSGQNAAKTTFDTASCIVIGNEAIGIQKSLHKSGTQITLPQQNTNISYNASVAAGIVLFLAATQKNIITCNKS